MTLPIETCIRRTPCIAFPEAVRLIQVSRYINAAVPPAGAGETGDNNRVILQFHIQRQKKYLHIRQLSFAGFASFVAAFFRLFHNYILLCAAKISSCNILSFFFTSFFVPIK